MAKEQLFRSYLSAALFLIRQYAGKTPLSLFLKDYFSTNKKYGSRDRKYISQLCYCYYRSGHALNAVPPEKKILSSLFLCSTESNDLLKNLAPEWNEKAAISLDEKIRLLGPEFKREDIFPWGPELSDGVDIAGFCLSHLIQPFIFLRIRPGHENAVVEKLDSRQIKFDRVRERCLALPNATHLEGIVILNREAVIQDLNSQNTGEFLKSVSWTSSREVWDCCAASGGKSLMLYDMKPDIKLTVSDVRENILHNLRKRFAVAGISDYKSVKIDLSASDIRLPDNKYQLIIADVPCSGSGTWSRTPEQLYFFSENKIGEYAALQQKISSNVIPALLPGAYLLYITCSVFKKENESIVRQLEQNGKLQLIKMEMFRGYDKKADTLFAALLKKPL